MSTGEPVPHAGGIPGTPYLRLQIVREFATQVFGKELMAAAWLGQLNDAVLGGVCIVASAAQTEDGFQQAMDELKRLDRLHRDANASAAGRVSPSEPVPIQPDSKDL